MTSNEGETSVPENTEQPVGEEEQQSEDARTFTQADLDRIVERRLSKERAKFADYDALKSAADELAQIREGEKTELQKAMERAEAAEKRAAAAEFESLRSKVAATKGVPAAALTGTTEEELAAAADVLLSWRDQNAPKEAPAEPKKTPAPSSGGFRSGASGTGPSNADPKSAAAEALRRLRSDH